MIVMIRSSGVPPAPDARHQCHLATMRNALPSAGLLPCGLEHARYASAEVRAPTHEAQEYGMDRRTALLFDLDGTLVDSVYQHVLA
jgi:hypothetical protein